MLGQYTWAVLRPGSVFAVNAACVGHVTVGRLMLASVALRTDRIHEHEAVLLAVSVAVYVKK